MDELGRSQKENMNDNILGKSFDYNFTSIHSSISYNENHCGNDMAYESLKLSPSRIMAKAASKDTKEASARTRKQRWTGSFTKATLLSMIASAPLATADCVSLSGSTQCPAFTSASVDTNLTGLLYVLISP